MNDSESNIGSGSTQSDGSGGALENLHGGIPDEIMNQALAELLDGKRRDDHAEELPERGAPLGTERTGNDGEEDERESDGPPAEEDEGGRDPGELPGASERSGEDTRTDGEADTAASGSAAAVAKLAEDKGGVYTLKELATALDIPTDALYKMKIPLGDGNSDLTSIEDLKQRHKALLPLDEERKQVAEQKAVLEARSLDHESRVVQARQELDGVVQLVRRFAPPEFIEKARELSRDKADQEARKLLEVMPKLRDPVSREAFTDKAVEALMPYGITRAEIAGFGDHRIFRVVDAFVRMSERLRELEDLSGDRKKPPKAMKRKASSKAGPKGKADKLAERAKQTGRREDQRAALDALVDEGAIFGS